MKRAVFLLFLLFANIFLLAHAIIPHHHHGGTVVALIDNHCTATHHHTHNKQHENVPHDHNCNDSSEQCILEEVYIRADNIPKISCHQNCDCGKLLFLILSGASDKLGLADEIGLPFQQKKLLASYHIQFISNSLGLRGPPVCYFF